MVLIFLATPIFLCSCVACGILNRWLMFIRVNKCQWRSLLQSNHKKLSSLWCCSLQLLYLHQVEWKNRHIHTHTHSHSHITGALLTSSSQTHSYPRTICLWAEKPPCLLAFVVNEHCSEVGSVFLTSLTTGWGNWVTCTGWLYLSWAASNASVQVKNRGEKTNKRVCTNSDDLAALPSPALPGKAELISSLSCQTVQSSSS